MAIPDYQSVMLPLLRSLGDRKEHRARELVDQLAQDFGLSDEERKQLLPSGRVPVFDNRYGWARTYLKKAGLVEYPRRGSIQITERGLKVLAEKPEEIDVGYLNRFEEFVEFRRTRRAKHEGDSEGVSDSTGTPEETLEDAYQGLRDNLAEELLRLIKGCSPAFFERLVVDLLVAMGYGGSRREAGEAIGQVGDGGIDGIIKEDRLGLDTIYLQAKRWEGSVGRPEIQKFAGALQGQRAHKGVFLTTGTFTKDAFDYVSRIGTTIILVDGVTLADLMIDHSVGVSPVATYEVKKVDSDYFIEG